MSAAASDVLPVLSPAGIEFSGKVVDLAEEPARFTEEQIAFALRQAETGTAVAEVIRKMGINEQTFYRWRKRTPAWAWPSCAG
jgi:hypothetical protein